MTEPSHHFSLTIQRKPNWIVLPLSGAWTLGWIGMTGTILYGLATDPDKLDDELILFLCLFFLTGLLVLNVFLWHLRGKERITIDDKELRIVKVGTILTVPRRFELDQIERISDTEKPTTPKWIRFWGLGGGQIDFVYLGQKKYFGQTLKLAEATEIIEKIKTRLPEE